MDSDQDYFRLNGYWSDSGMTYEEIWGVDRSQEVRNRTWWWWWWIYFFKNPNDPRRPKQLMVLWLIRNSSKILVDTDHLWKHQGKIELDGPIVSGDGITVGWYFDGEKMIDPLFIESGRVQSRFDDDKGKVSLISENVYQFTGNPGKFGLKVENKHVGIALSMTEYNGYLSDVVDTGKSYFLNLSYRMNKIRRMNVKGTITREGKDERVEGSCYFQKVRISSPTTPWYWGIFHAEDGSFLDYFMPHLGLPMFRRKHEHKSWLDRFERMLSTSFQFYDARTATLHRFKKIRMEKSYEGGLPRFRLSGAEGGKEFDMTMETYGRATRRIQQPFLGILNTVLYYNEYPAYLSTFRFDDGTERRDLVDLGRVVGNCEHSWGVV